MRRGNLFRALLAGAVLAAAAFPGLPLEKGTLKADVELLVRVFDGGRPVAGLAREQFRLREDGEERPIRDFSENARGLRIPGADPGKPRCLALLFTVLDYNAPLRAALDRLFADVLRPQDRLLVVVNHSPLAFQEVGGGPETRAALDQLLGEQAAAARRQMDQYVNKFTLDFDMRKFRQSMQDENDDSFRLGQWLTTYTEAWREYRRLFLYPDREALRQLAQPLAQVRLDKWLISFQQYEIHTHITMSRPEFRMIDGMISRLQDMQTRTVDETVALQSIERKYRMLKELAQKVLSVPDDFPAGDMQRVLEQAGATYHAILIPAIVGSDSDVSKFDLRSVNSGIEETMRGIARGAGGTLAVTADPAAAVAALEDARDVFYRMIYTAEVKKEGRIQIDVPGKRYSLVYDEVPLVGAAGGAGLPAAQSAQAAAAAGSLRINGARFEKKKLVLELGGFALAKQGKKIVGRVNVHVRLEDNNSDATVFDQARDMVCEKEAVALGIDFPKLPAGFYTLTVEVRDLLSGQETSENQSLEIE
jgi:hypothetical protein